MIKSCRCTHTYVRTYVYTSNPGIKSREILRPYHRPWAMLTPCARRARPDKHNQHGSICGRGHQSLDIRHANPKREN